MMFQFGKAEKSPGDERPSKEGQNCLQDVGKGKIHGVIQEQREVMCWNKSKIKRKEGTGAQNISNFFIEKKKKKRFQLAERVFGYL